MSTPIAVPSVATLQGLGSGAAAALANAVNAAGGLVTNGGDIGAATGTSVTLSDFARLATAGTIPNPSTPQSITDIVGGLEEIVYVVPMTGQLLNIYGTANGGSGAKNNSNWLTLKSNTTANGVACAGFNDGAVNNTAAQMHRQWSIDQRQMAWAKPNAVKYTFGATAISTNGMYRLFYGKKLAGNAAPSGKGIGVRFNASGQPIIMAHDGTTLTETSAFSAVSGWSVGSLRVVEVLLFSNGAGTVTLYVNGALVGSTSGGPTTTGNQNEACVSAEANNGGDTANTTLDISSLAFLRP